MIHTFLAQSGEGHGRGFQLIAEAMEEKAFELLGVRVRIGRLEGLIGDVKERGGLSPHMAQLGPRGPSALDVEVYGFLEPLQLSHFCLLYQQVLLLDIVLDVELGK
jgi:hypothetical protein